MLINEFGLYGLIGRAGTTLIRNQLGKYNNIMCLTTDMQIKLLMNNYTEIKISTYIINEYSDYDIKNQFSKYKFDYKQVDKLFYKLPLYQVLNKSSLEYCNRIKPIFVIRNPVHTVYSSSKQSFLNDSEDLDIIKEMILESCTLLKIKMPKVYLEDFKRYSNDILLKNAVLFKMSFFLYQEYFKKFYKDNILFLCFEDFLDNPYENMKLILDFSNVQYNKDQINKKLNELFYDEVIEEGGILMSENLKKSKKIIINDKFERIFKYLENEMNYFGYSLDNTIYPKSKILQEI